MKTNMFAKAKVIEAPVKPGKKDDKSEVRISGLEDYAIVTNLVKSLTAVQNTVGEEVKQEMRKIFANNRKRPENFRGVDGKASASCELRKRSSTSPLNDAEVELLERNDIPYDTLPVVEERFVINPAYADDQDLLERISAALSKVKGLPEDFILLQKGSAKKVVSDKTIEKVFECGLADRFIDTVCTLAIKPKLDETDVDSTLARAKKFLAAEKKEA